MSDRPSADTPPSADRATLREPRAPSRPGDEAPAGAPGTGENVCPKCHGRGRLYSDRSCPDCCGTGRITTAIGGG